MFNRRLFKPIRPCEWPVVSAHVDIKSDFLDETMTKSVNLVT